MRLPSTAVLFGLGIALAAACSRAPGLSAQVTAAIVTCGGLCPGLNDVVQNIVYTLADYGVPLDQVRKQALSDASPWQPICSSG